jgi:NADH:ubiquinone oxidoreductase subunit 3 (subunit A)
MSSNNNNTGSGIGFTGLLAILFIALKLTHVIAWSWWLVLSPLWIAAVITILILIIVAFIATGKNRKRR